MSAICAAYRWDGAPVSGVLAQRLLAAMQEYGAEATYWAPETPEAPVALGCIPWRVTPEDAFYHGPVRSDSDDVVVVADIRIDNRDDLAARLDISAADAVQLSDAALVLAAWRRWQRECPRYLVGDFAFIIWDARKRELFCARDAMGHRVLFYHESAHGVEVATTAHALATLPDSAARLNEQKVADFLTLIQRTESSFFDGILRLPPAHTLTVGRAGLRLDRYWSPAPDRMLRLASDQEYVEAFTEVYEAAVRSQLRCNGSVSIMASGGLDSASVAAVAARQLGQQGRTLHAFHAAPRAGYALPMRRAAVADESGDVEALARMYPNMQLQVRRTDGRSPFDGIEQSFRMTGAPVRNPVNAPWFLGIYEQIAQAGHRVVLSGHKGNATISQTGLRSLRDSALRGHWRRVWREMHALARATGQGRRDVLRREVVLPLMPAAISASVRWLSRARAQPYVTFSAINPDFAREMNVELRARESNRHPDVLDHLSEIDFRLTVLAAGADVYDLYSGFRPWFGLETRDPTADRRVVEFCMSVPGSQYLQNGVTRSLLRRAMAARLPDQIRLRSTLGMQAADWPEWLPSIRGELSAELNRLEASDTARRCLDLPKLRQLIERWPSPLTQKHNNDYALLLLRGVTMGRFIRWFEESYT